MVEARLKREVRISEEQYGFVPGRGTTNAIFTLRMLIKKHREGQKELHCVFADLEKVYDRVPRGELWHYTRKLGVAKKYVMVAKDIYDESETAVRCAAAMTEGFKVEFADDFVLCVWSREEVEEELERWRYALERKGMEVSRSKTDYVCSNERDSLETVRWRRSMKSTTWGQPYKGMEIVIEK
nr:uncharacterized protein LOC113806671 [Penaeus vannamei]